MRSQDPMSLNRSLLILLVLALSGALVAALSHGRLMAIVVVLTLALAKGSIVILDFMEMRGTKGGLKPALLAWPTALLTLALARSVAVRFLL